MLDFKSIPNKHHSNCRTKLYCSTYQNKILLHPSHVDKISIIVFSIILGLITGIECPVAGGGGRVGRVGEEEAPPHRV